MKSNIVLSLQISALCLSVGSSPAKFRSFLDCHCGESRPSQVQPSLVRGEAGRNEFPWAARLEITIGQKSFQCGGTLVSDRHVLTAAHCVKPGNESLYVTVILGRSRPAPLSSLTFNIQENTPCPGGTGPSSPCSSTGTTSTLSTRRPTGSTTSLSSL